tara:strand:+ start:169 stop:414 length:246 start_codon:yes stop_codon:yes gene_type:complete
MAPSRGSSKVLVDNEAMTPAPGDIGSQDVVAPIAAERQDRQSSPVSFLKSGRERGGSGRAVGRVGRDGPVAAANYYQSRFS